MEARKLNGNDLRRSVNVMEGSKDRGEDTDLELNDSTIDFARDSNDIASDSEDFLDFGQWLQDFVRLAVIRKVEKITHEQSLQINNGVFQSEVSVPALERIYSFLPRFKTNIQSAMGNDMDINMRLPLAFAVLLIPNSALRTPLTEAVHTRWRSSFIRWRDVQRTNTEKYHISLWYVYIFSVKFQEFIYPYISR